MRPATPIVLLFLLSGSVTAEDTEVTFDLESMPVDLPPAHPQRNNAPSWVALKLDAENAMLTWTDASLRKRTFKLDVLGRQAGTRGGDWRRR